MLPPTINIFEKAARKAGKILTRDFGEIENLQIQSKSVGDFVTNADIKVENSLLETLRYYYPNANYITEESGSIKPGALQWIVLESQSNRSPANISAMIGLASLKAGSSFGNRK